MAATARSGWIGANHVSAPEAPSASRTILLQTGQPTAKNVSTPPATPNRDGRSSPSLGSGADPGSRTYVANTSPLSTAVTMSTGHDHHVTPTSRPKIGVGIIAVGTATTSTVTSAVAIAAPHRRVDQLFTYTPRSMYGTYSSWSSGEPGPLLEGYRCSRGGVQVLSRRGTGPLAAAVGQPGRRGDRRRRHAGRGHPRASA